MIEHKNSDQNADTAAYVLNALNEQERTEFETALAESEETEREVIELRDTATMLGFAVDPVQPSVELKANIMARLNATPQLPPVATQPSERHPVASISETTTVSGAAESRARTRWFLRPGGMLAAAAVAAVLFLGGTLVGQSIVRNDFEVAQATALAQLQTAADSEQASVDLAGGGTATLVWSSEQQRSAILIDGLGQLPSGETYQLWYIGEQGPVSAGTFEAAESGTTWRVLDGEITGGDVVGVTVEPDGGSPQPTTEPIIAIQSA